MDRNAQKREGETVDQIARLFARVEPIHPVQRDPIGRLQAACDEAALASEQLALERLPLQRLTSLLVRTDQMLTELEKLNLLDAARVPEAGLLELAALVADLPLGYASQIGPSPSPTAAMDVVFDVQAGLLRSITGSDVEREEQLWRAS